MSDLAWLSRSELLIGKENINKLQNSHVLVVGLGGVGSFAAEFICRAGVGQMTIVDGDVVDPTNRNRQLPALFTTHGLSKAAWMEERLLAINPDLKLTVINEFLSPVRCEELLQNDYDYVMDCIDSITPKLTLIAAAYKSGKKVVSSMGAGGKTDPTQIRVADLYDTHTCKLAFYVRKRLKKMAVAKGVRAVFSLEEMDKDSLIMTDGSNFKQSAYGTISYLPAAFGGVAASVVIRDLLGIEVETQKRPKMMKSSNIKKKK
jgi:tRNA A37 threonylcarbamoyladenosine dehydratase